MLMLGMDERRRSLVKLRSCSFLCSRVFFVVASVNCNLPTEILTDKTRQENGERERERGVQPTEGK